MVKYAWVTGSPSPKDIRRGPMSLVGTEPFGFGERARHGRRGFRPFYEDP